MLRRAALLAGGAMGCAWFAPSFAKQQLNPHIANLQSFLDLPDSQIDLGKVKLLIDQMVDPKVDIAWAASQLDFMKTAVENMVVRAYFERSAPWASKIDALRTYLLYPGAVERQHRLQVRP